MNNKDTNASRVIADPAESESGALSVIASGDGGILGYGIRVKQGSSNYIWVNVAIAWKLGYRLGDPVKVESKGTSHQH
jgi:hypothetical protein